MAEDLIGEDRRRVAFPPIVVLFCLQKWASSEDSGAPIDIAALGVVSRRPFRADWLDVVVRSRPFLLVSGPVCGRCDIPKQFSSNSARKLFSKQHTKSNSQGRRSEGIDKGGLLILWRIANENCTWYAIGNSELLTKVNAEDDDQTLRRRAVSSSTVEPSRRGLPLAKEVPQATKRQRRFCR